LNGTPEAIPKPSCHSEGGSATEKSTLLFARFFDTLRFAQNDGTAEGTVLKSMLV
jgi:hypothetical protein